MVPRTDLFCPSLVIPASSRGSSPLLDLADAVEGNLGSASVLARFFVGLVDAAEEKENFGSASALARFFMGLADATEENLGRASALAWFFMVLFLAHRGSVPPPRSASEYASSLDSLT